VTCSSRLGGSPYRLFHQSTFKSCSFFGKVIRTGLLLSFSYRDILAVIAKAVRLEPYHNIPLESATTCPDPLDKSQLIFAAFPYTHPGSNPAIAAATLAQSPFINTPQNPPRMQGRVDTFQPVVLQFVTSSCSNKALAVTQSAGFFRVHVHFYVIQVAVTSVGNWIYLWRYVDPLVFLSLWRGFCFGAVSVTPASPRCSNGIRRDH
jgi:hypothetical protein